MRIINSKVKSQNSKFQVKTQNSCRSSFKLSVTVLNFEFCALSFRHRRGFTLIEAMSVVAIIGILASLSMYAYTSATSRSRDARRKSDLTAISLGFQARHDAKACSDQGDIGFYPGYKIGWPADGRWKSTEVLRTLSNDCGAFSEYLITIPTDPSSSGGGLNYLFDLSHEPPPDGGVIGKHYRLTAKLEKVITPNSPEGLALVRAVEVWQTSFGGAPLPQDQGYNYIIGN